MNHIFCFYLVYAACFLIQGAIGIKTASDRLLSSRRILSALFSNSLMMKSNRSYGWFGSSTSKESDSEDKKKKKKRSGFGRKKKSEEDESTDDSEDKKDKKDKKGEKKNPLAGIVDFVKREKDKSKTGDGTDPSTVYNKLDEMAKEAEKEFNDNKEEGKSPQKEESSENKSDSESKPEEKSDSKEEVVEEAKEVEEPEEVKEDSTLRNSQSSETTDPSADSDSTPTRKRRRESSSSSSNLNDEIAALNHQVKTQKKLLKKNKKLIKKTEHAAKKRGKQNRRHKKKHTRRRIRSNKHKSSNRRNHKAEPMGAFSFSSTTSSSARELLRHDPLSDFKMKKRKKASNRTRNKESTSSSSMLRKSGKYHKKYRRHHSSSTTSSCVDNTIETLFPKESRPLPKRDDVYFLDEKGGMKKSYGPFKDDESSPFYYPGLHQLDGKIGKRVLSDQEYRIHPSFMSKLADGGFYERRVIKPKDEKGADVVEERFGYFPKNKVGGGNRRRKNVKTKHGVFLPPLALTNNPYTPGTEAHLNYHFEKEKEKYLCREDAIENEQEQGLGILDEHFENATDMLVDKGRRGKLSGADKHLNDVSNAITNSKNKAETDGVVKDKIFSRVSGMMPPGPPAAMVNG